MRIFLAEDEQDLNAIIVQKLTEDGYSCLLYTSNKQGVADYDMAF